MSANDVIQTPFKDAIFKDTSMSGDNVNQTNGEDIKDGMGGTARTMPEVTTVSVKGDDAPGRNGGSSIKGS